MSTTITGKLKDQAREFPAGSSTGFGFRLGVQYYCRTDKEKKWTNYEAAVFSSNENMIGFMRQKLVPGAIVTVTAKTLQIKEFQGTERLILSIGMNDCNLDFVFAPDGQQAPPQQQQGGYQQAPQQAPQQQPPQQQQQRAPQQNNRQQSPNQNIPQSNQYQNQPQQQQPAPDFTDFDDDIPFANPYKNIEYLL